MKIEGRTNHAIGGGKPIIHGGKFDHSCGNPMVRGGKACHSRHKTNKPKKTN
jgi:hypothetical protein